MKYLSILLAIATLALGACASREATTSTQTSASTTSTGYSK